MSSEVLPVPEPELKGEVGRCGDRAPQVVIGGNRAFCRLPAGHAGWHRGDDDSEWSRESPDYATAYGSLHEVVRAFLAGERNARYLRRLHAEIESELTGGGGEPWRCDRCGDPRWARWRNGPPHEGWPLKAQCVPCGHVQELSEVSRG